jgi:hypothetical protein
MPGVVVCVEGLPSQSGAVGQTLRAADLFGALMGRSRGRPTPLLLSADDDVARAEHRRLADEIRAGHGVPRALRAIARACEHLHDAGLRQGAYVDALARDVADRLMQESEAEVTLERHFGALHLACLGREARDAWEGCAASLAEELSRCSPLGEPILTLEDGLDMCRIVMAIEAGKVAAAEVLGDLDALAQIMPSSYGALANVVRALPSHGRTPDEMLRALGQRRWEQIFAHALRESPSPTAVEGEILNAADTRLRYLVEQMRLEERDAARG